MNYSDYIKIEPPERRSNGETNCFPPSYFEYKSSLLMFFQAYSLFDCLNFEPICSWQSEWSGERNAETGEPSVEARKLMRDFIFEQVRYYIESLPWDEDGKLPEGTAVKALKKYNAVRFPDVLDEQTVKAELDKLRAEPNHCIPAPMPEEAIEWFNRDDL